MGSLFKTMIFELYIWTMAFISVFLSIFWIMVNYVYENKKTEELRIFPSVTIAIPVWNEERAIIPTLESILKLDYPRDKLDIIIVDDKSTDNTASVVEDFLKQKQEIRIRLLKHKENKGKAGAVNTALAHSDSKYFWVFDADSIATRDLLKNIVARFEELENSDVAAVVAITMIKNNGNWVERMQRLEYVMAAFVRKLMSNVDTLHTTNALSIFKTDVLKKVGGFDVGNLTEDFEIAMRLRSNGYRIVMCEKGRFYTNVPSTIKKMWMQRVRWFRGYIYNNLKYKKMLFNKRLGMLGLFQIPIEIFILLSVFFSVVFFAYNFFILLYDLFFQAYIMKWGFFEFTMPTLRMFILNINWKLFFPSLIVLVFGLFLYFSAHKYVNEKWKFYIPSLLYLFVYPLFRSMQWIHAFVLEFGRAERKW